MLGGVDIAGGLNAVFGREAAPATLVKIAPGTRGSTVSAGTNPTSTNYSARGWIEAYSTDDIDGTLIQRNDRKISLLARSITGAVPADGDKITIKDLDGTSRTFRVINVQGSGPQGALYICQGRIGG